MAHIKRMTDKRRTLPWRAQVKRRGHPTQVKMFQTRAQAESWAREQEKSILERGLPLTTKHLERHTIEYIVRKYLEEITPTKGCRVSESATFKAFLRCDPMAKMSMAYVNTKHVWDYITRRQHEVTPSGSPISNTTIRREMNSLSHVFEVARERWGFANLVNPFRGVKLRGSMKIRRRRLQEGEYDLIIEHCKNCRGENRYYVPLAIDLAIGTGMRLDEIFNLKWEDIDFDKQRIEIRKSKTDYQKEFSGRTIALPVIAELRLLVLSAAITTGKFPYAVGKAARIVAAGSSIFPVTKNAFQQSFRDVCKRAKIAGLQFRDLRREARSRFDETVGLTKAEQDLMLGHKNRDMAGIYVSPDLKRIREKLERHALKGRTWAEVHADMVDKGGIDPEQIVGFRAFVISKERDLPKAKREQRERTAILRFRSEAIKRGVSNPDTLRTLAKNIPV